MKKTNFLKSLVLITFLIPSISFASWWNPFSWFDKEQTIEISTEISTSTPLLIPETKIESNWWNPLSWGKKENTNKQEIATTTEEIIIEPKTPVSANNGDENQQEKQSQLDLETAKAKAEAERYRLQAEQTKLELEKLKQQSQIQNQTQTETKQEENKNTTITLPNGAIVEMDENGNIIKTIKEATYIPPEPTQTSQQSSQNQTQDNTGELNITNIDVTNSATSVVIEWRTTIPTKGKVFLTGENLSSEPFNSQSGLSTQHKVTISGLTHNSDYSYEIEAISTSSSFKKITGNFKTQERVVASLETDTEYAYTWGSNCGSYTFSVITKDQLGEPIFDIPITFTNPETGEKTVLYTKSSNGESVVRFQFTPQTHFHNQSSIKLKATYIDKSVEKELYLRETALEEYPFGSYPESWELVDMKTTIYPEPDNVRKLRAKGYEKETALINKKWQQVGFEVFFDPDTGMCI